MSSTNSTLTPTDQLLLVGLGQSLLKSFAAVVATVLLYGIFIPIFISFIRSFIQSRNFTKRSITSLVISLSGFLISTLRLCTKLAIVSLFIRSALVGQPKLPLRQKQVYTNQVVLNPNIVDQWAASLLPPIGDSIVIWRAWILFERKRVLFILPFFLLFSSYVVTIAYLIAICIQGIHANVEGILYDVSLPLSAATNLVGTGFIVAKYWMHRSSLPKELRSSAWSLKVMVRLIESGGLYCMFQLTYLFIGLVPSSRKAGSAGDLAEQIFVSIYFSIAGMYPTIVSVLVKNSSDDTSPRVIDGFAVGNATDVSRHQQSTGVVSRPIAFAASNTMSVEHSEEGDHVFSDGGQEKRDESDAEKGRMSF